MQEQEILRSFREIGITLVESGKATMVQNRPYASVAISYLQERLKLEPTDNRTAQSLMEAIRVRLVKTGRLRFHSELEDAMDYVFKSFGLKGQSSVIGSDLLTKRVVH